MSYLQSRWPALALVLAGLSCNIYAVDGVVLIDQNRALAGNVTPGDAPGFPVTISVPGSYRLSGNLMVPDAHTSAISITADHVTIDLNGFSIIGPTVCTGRPVTACNPTTSDNSGHGVDGGSQNNVTVLNGSVSGMGGFGISLLGIGGSVEKVHADNNHLGIALRFGTVSGSISIANFTYGISCANATCTGNVARGNGSAGILASCPASVVGNTSFLNGQNLLTSRRARGLRTH